MTAVNWMIDQLIKKHVGNVGNEYVKIFEEAKQMEKQQMHKCASFWRGKENEIEIPIFEQYYNETYGSKGSDENFKQFSLYEHKETIATADTPTSSQTEISDEEIEMAALHNEPRVTRRAFRSGAKWYREQLKCKGNG